MTTWTRSGRKVTNADNQYRHYLDSLGAEQIDHYTVIRFGDPMAEDFLDDINIIKHIYSTGDTLSKIAFEHYGDPRYWWLIAWFNSKPTDFHCKIGDTIIVPLPLQEVLIQAQRRGGQL